MPALELRDVELLHAKHRALRLRRFVILQHLGQSLRHDLPGEAISVLQPPALLCLRIAALRQLLPVVVDLVLRVAEHLQRDRLVELERGAAIERRERLAVDLEVDDHHRSRGPLVYLLAGFRARATERIFEFRNTET